MSTSETVIVNGESRSLPETRSLRSLLGELGVDAERARSLALDVGRALGPLEVNATLFESVVEDALELLAGGVSETDAAATEAEISA